MRYTLSPRGADFITTFEDFRENAYLDVAGIWTIGYGSTRIDGRPVVAGQTITREQARLAFMADVATVLRFLESSVLVPLTQSQVDALTSLCYNIGVGAFQRSTLRRTLNARQTPTEKMFTDWNKVRKNGQLVVSNGLTRRRKAEYALFMEQV